MSDIDLTQAVEAAARRFAVDVTRPAWDDLPATARMNMQKAMDPLITAALPHIERQVREQVAREIEAVDPIEWALAGQSAGADAARIARGDS